MTLQMNLRPQWTPQLWTNLHLSKHIMETVILETVKYCRIELVHSPLALNIKAWWTDVMKLTMRSRFEI